MTSRTRARQAGFSYIEILVGILILAIVAGGIAQGLATTSASLGTSKVDQTAVKLGTSELDRAHRMDYEDVGISGGSPPGIIAATSTVTVGSTAYKIDRDVIYIDDPALGQPQTYVNYKKVTVTVTPQVQRSHPFSSSTLIAPPAIGAIAGKSTIVATVIDALTDQPIQGAPVTADLSTSPTQTRTTDSDGKVVFAGLEPSAIPVNDPKYKYRLTVGLTDPWVTHADSVPAVAQQHLAASQTWTTTLKVYKRATLQVNLRDATTGAFITERSEVNVTTPGPDVVSDDQFGFTGSFVFNSLVSKPIMPSASNFRVDAQADCYRSEFITRPVPTGYPANTTETFNFSLTRVPSGYLDVRVRSTAAGNPVIPGAEVQVSGGQAGLPIRVRTADAAGFVRFCLDPSGSADYVVSAAQPGYGGGSMLAPVLQNQTTPMTLILPPAVGTGSIRLIAPGPNRLVRLMKYPAGAGTYDASQVTNAQSRADFTGLAAGTYMAYIATGFSGGVPVWNLGKSVTAPASGRSDYTVP